jgi:hypothetical protein
MPGDKAIAAKFLTFYINVGFIRWRYFGFLKGLGCIDAVSYLIEIIYNNKKVSVWTHLFMIDFHAAFDTMDHVIFVESMEYNFQISGNALNYIVASLHGRWSRVVINGYKSDYREDIVGGPQGWPPMPIFWIVHSIELDMINTLNLGIILQNYADDINLISAGSVTENVVLEKNFNFCIRIIVYICKIKRIIMEPTKQKYVVFKKDKKVTKQQHKDSYLNLKIEGEAASKVYGSVKYL